MSLHLHFNNPAPSFEAPCNPASQVTAPSLTGRAGGESSHCTPPSQVTAPSLEGGRGEGPGRAGGESSLSLIAAIAKNRAIGLRGQLLYRLPADMRRFRELTTGHTVVMGRRTFLSLPKGALPNRRNLVLTHDAAFAAPGVETFGSLDDAIAACKGETEVFVIGGESVYAAALPLAHRLLLTEVDDEPKEADAFFPEWKAEEWRVASVSAETYGGDSAMTPPYRFVDYERAVPVGDTLTA